MTDRLDLPPDDAPEGFDHPPDDDAEREALAARVNAGPPAARPYDEVAEEAAQAALRDCQARLGALRGERDEINARIRDLVTQEERLVKAVAAFNRSRRG